MSRVGWRPLAGIVASAIVFGLFARGGFAYVLGFVALLPWLLALDANATVAGALRSAWLMSIAFVLAVLAWFGVAIGEFTGLGSLLGLLVLVACAPLLQPQLLAFALVRQLAGRRHGPMVRALAGAAAWVATEWLVPRLLGDTLGYGLYPSLLLRQGADVGGAAGLTFLLILVNECLAHTVAQRRRGLPGRTAPIAAAAIVVLMAGYGLARSTALNAAPPPADSTLTLGLVQSNITHYERLRQEMGAYGVVRHVLDTHYAMSREAVAGGVDALLWSETVYPTTFAHPKSGGGAELDREILDFVKAAGVPLVFGTYDLDAQGEYNAAAFIDPSMGTLGFYRKTNAFPLTEYVPAWLDSPALRRWLPWTGTWQRGDGARVYPLRTRDGHEIPVLPLICLDDMDSNLAIDGARLGAQAILTMSNDSWFTSHPIGAELHLHAAAFRSIETRLPQLRVTANGVSAVIDGHGTVGARTGVGEQKLLIGRVEVREPPATLMVAWGDWVGRAGFAFLLLLAGLAVVDGFSRRSARRAGIGADVKATGAGREYRADAAMLAPPWRVAAALLRVLAGAGLLWVGMGTLAGDGEPANSLTQMWMFAALVLAPATAAWAIGRAFAATVRIEGGRLVLEQAQRRTEIELRDIAEVKPWTLPLPGAGVWLRLHSSSQRWAQGIALADPAALIEALIRAGATPALAADSASLAAIHARIRAAAPRWRIDHPLIKFVLFPLLPALPAFRLHQHIAYGGTFGEYYTYGLEAYLIALLIWWASWAIGMVLYATVLRVLIEAGAALSLALRPARAIGMRKALEGAGRLLYFVGVPVFLLSRLLPG